MDKFNNSAHGFPHFIGIGAARSGTTWLHNQLTHQGNIWLPPVKEVHYFDRSTHYNSPDKLAVSSPLSRLMNPARWNLTTMMKFCRDFSYSIVGKNDATPGWWLHWYLGTYDDEWYRKLFSSRKELLKGEITPAYSILGREDIRKIHCINPDAKLILLLRDPIERDWSSLRKSVDRGHMSLDLDCEESVQKTLGEKDIFARSNYMEMLRRYLDVFPADQLLVGFFDAITHDPQGLLDSILDFIGMDCVAADHSLLGRRINSSPNKDIPTGVFNYLLKVHRETITDIQQLLGSYSLNWYGESDGVDVYHSGFKPTILASQFSL